MRAALLALAFIPALALAADALAETSPRLNGWLASAAGQVAEATPPVADAAGSVLVSAEVEANQRLSKPRIVRSSGSRVTDDAVLAATKRIRIKASTPEGLVDGRVTLKVAVRALETVSADAATNAAR